MTRRRLLAVTSAAPWPRRGGFSLRAAHVLEQLAPEWDISVIATCDVDRDAVPWPASVSHELISCPLSTSLWTDSNPAAAPQRDLRALREAVDGVLENRRPHAALLFNGTEFLAFGREDFPPAIGDRIDCGTLERLRYARRNRFGLQQLKALGAAVSYARYERKLVRELDTTLVVGGDDARALERISARKTVIVVPNGVHAQALPNFEAESPIPTVAFTGTLSYHANLDAIRYFAHVLWPDVRRNVKEARFLIAGRNPPHEVLELDRVPGVEVRPDVSDMVQVLQETWLAIAPMRCGTGVKNKVLEAWAVGRPVVLTPLAANGLRLDERMRKLVLAEPGDFCRAIVDLLRDQSSRHRCGREALALARSRHSWRETGAAVSKLLATAAQRVAGGAP